MRIISLYVSMGLQVMKDITFRQPENPGGSLESLSFTVSEVITDINPQITTCIGPAHLPPTQNDDSNFLETNEGRETAILLFCSSPTGVLLSQVERRCCHLGNPYQGVTTAPWVIWPDSDMWSGGTWHSLNTALLAAGDSCPLQTT